MAEEPRHIIRDVIEYMTSKPEAGFEWRMDYGKTSTNGTTYMVNLWDAYAGTASSYTLPAHWYSKVRVTETKRKRSLALPVAVAHAAFFFALAVAGWVR